MTLSVGNFGSMSLHVPILGTVKVFSDAVQLMGPLLAKVIYIHEILTAIINFAKEQFVARESGEPGPKIGRGIGLAIGLLCIPCTFVVMQQQDNFCARGSRMKNFSWTAPIQIIICPIILLVQSLDFHDPIQERAMVYQFNISYLRAGKGVYTMPFVIVLIVLMKADNEYYTDLENRALYPTITNQQWLAVRLEFLSAIMVLVVGILAVVGNNGIAPGPNQSGLDLHYLLGSTLEITTKQSAEVESKKRHIHTKGSVKPPQGWPSEGTIKFKDVVMSYRPGLDPGLKGISMSIRTDAGIDISSGLRDLHSKIAFIPQEPLLSSGTIQTNLDPFSVYGDAQL
ncbi:hypothetical protein BU17DRAFT_60013 [Hysterangium stoloniferum]|nr:hypothetical protein BU17DRAFT_60013 [Hysterangium stoloniferum]